MTQIVVMDSGKSWPRLAALRDSDTGFLIRYCFSGNLFNLRRLQAKFKVLTDVLDELLYAGDMDKNALIRKLCHQKEIPTPQTEEWKKLK